MLQRAGYTVNVKTDSYGVLMVLHSMTGRSEDQGRSKRTFRSCVPLVLIHSPTLTRNDNRIEIPTISGSLHRFAEQESVRCGRLE